MQRLRSAGSLRFAGVGRVLRRGLVAEGKSFQAVLELMKDDPKKLVVVDWTAEWCGPCKMMLPLLEEMSESYPEVSFVKLDVDRFQQDAIDAGVRAMPTIYFMKDQLVVHQITGADPAKVVEAIKTYK